MASPEDPGVLAWLADKAWTVLAALVGLVWRSNQEAHRTTRKLAVDALQAHAQEDDRRFVGIEDEQQLQRGYIAKLFDKLEEHGKRAEDRHVEMLKALHSGLNSKADK